MRIDRYVVAGNPVEHSQSPFIHAAFARETGQSMVYERLLCPQDGFDATIRALAAGGAKGCNVTVPFKFAAFALATELTPRARLAGAVNTLRFEGADWLGDNTDGVGLVRDIEQNTGVTLADRRVLLIGAGGASAGVLGPLLAAGPAELVVANRSRHKADALVEQHRPVAHASTRLRATTLDAPGTGFDIVVNASASSLAGAAVPVPAGVLRPGALALDTMYGPSARSFLDWATAHSAIGRDGLGMLVEQAAEAFALWRGVRPATASVLVALRKRLASAG